MKYLILGAGPAGLAFANRLKQLGKDDYLLIEEQNEAGGLCRSIIVDGSPFDMGGGHFLDVRRPIVNKFLFGFMPENEWNIYVRNSKIFLHDHYIDHPFEANIWQLDMEEQISYLKSIAQAGCNNGEEKPTDFVKWISWKLGDKIAENYMIPYNQKMFGKHLSELGTYWMEKLPNVSFEDTLRSCLSHKAFAKQPGHAQFYYPKAFGYGELWLRMAVEIKENVIYNEKAVKIDFERRIVSTDKGIDYTADIIVTTVPWASFEKIEGVPKNITENIKKLKHNSIQIAYMPDNMDIDAHWIYYPDPKLSFHRVLIRSNFCNNSRGYWTETNITRVADDKNIKSLYKNVCEYAYPLNTIEKPLIMKELLSYGRDHGIYGLGRWGEHEHYNSDLTVERAMKMAEELV